MSISIGFILYQTPTKLGASNKNMWSVCCSLVAENFLLKKNNQSLEACKCHMRKESQKESQRWDSILLGFNSLDVKKSTTHTITGFEYADPENFAKLVDLIKCCSQIPLISFESYFH